MKIIFLDIGRMGGLNTIKLMWEKCKIPVMGNQKEKEK